MPRISCKIAVFLSLIMLLVCSTSIAAELTLNNTPAQVYFSPSGGCTDAIVKEIGKAKAEEKNAENLLILKSKELAKQYIDNWNKHKSHSQEYTGRQ